MRTTNSSSNAAPARISTIPPRVGAARVNNRAAATSDAGDDDTYTTTHDLANEQRARVSRRTAKHHDPRIALAHGDEEADVVDTSSAPELARAYAKVKSMPRTTLTLRKSSTSQSRSTP